MIATAKQRRRLEEMQAVIDILPVGERLTTVQVNARLWSRFGRKRTQILLAGLEKRGLVSSEFVDGKLPRVYWRAS